MTNVGGEVEVAYYADDGPEYELCLVYDINDPCVITYETEKEALNARFNSNDFVLRKIAEERIVK